MKHISKSFLLCFAITTILITTASCGTDTTPATETDTTEITSSFPTNPPPYIGYTGYMDECTQWELHERFIRCDYDMDDKEDRIYREELGDFCNYQVEFGNGDILRIESVDPAGLPRFESIYCPRNNENFFDAERKYLFTLSYPHCENPRGAGRIAIFEKRGDAYYPMELPLSTGNSSYEYGITCNYQKTDSDSVHVVCQEGAVQADTSLPNSSEHWQNDTSSALCPIYQVKLINHTDDSRARLLCYSTPFGGQSSDEIRTILTLCDNTWEIEQIQYMAYYEEHFPVSVKEGEKHELRLHGFYDSTSAIYELTGARLYAIHGETEEYLSNVSFFNSSVPLMITDSRDGDILIRDLTDDGSEDFTVYALREDGSKYYRNFVWVNRHQLFMEEIPDPLSPFSGYLDEYTSYSTREFYYGCDYDGDGKTDRIYVTGTKFKNDYRIEFGNGDLLTFENAGHGMPYFYSVKTEGSDDCQILFQQHSSVNYSGDSFFETAIFEKRGKNYCRLDLPFSYGELYDSTYANSLTDGDTIYKVHEIEINPEENGDTLICHASAIDKNDSLIATLVFENGSWVIRQLQHKED